MAETRRRDVPAGSMIAALLGSVLLIRALRALDECVCRAVPRRAIL